MKKNTFNKAIAVSLVSTTLLATPVTTFANTIVNSANQNNNQINEVNPRASVNSKYKYFTVYGKNYHNYTTISTIGSTRATGRTSIMASSTVPAGYMGVHCNLYNAKTGRVVRTADWTTNNSSASGYATNATYDGSGSFYTRGTTKAYNGNGYTTQSANQSPTLSTRSNYSQISDKELAERQNLYDTKGMIAAVGVNDINGYVSLSDLYDESNQPRTPEEFLSLQSKRRSIGFRMIPLYDKDGKTIIGEYRIDCSQENIELIK